MTRTTRSPNSFVFKACVPARPQAAFVTADRESRIPDSRAGRIARNAARLLPIAGYVIAISLATWGLSHLVGNPPHPSAAACTTSGVRSLASANLLGVGELCTLAAGDRANVNVDQLKPGGTYTILLIDDVDARRACPSACAPEPKHRTLPTRTVRVVDTTNADQSGSLHVSQEIPALKAAHGTTMQLMLMEFVRGPATRLTEAASPGVAHHRADRLPDDDFDSAVAEATFEFP